MCDFYSKSNLLLYLLLLLNYYYYYYYYYTFQVSQVRHLKSTQFLKCLALFVGYRLFLGQLFFGCILCLPGCQSVLYTDVFSSTSPVLSESTYNYRMTTTLTFQTFCNSFIKTWYLPIFSCFLMAMFRSPEIAKSIICHSILLVDTNYVW